eukprot:COSAG02_NODE_3143_length_7292_cov_20.803698_1_plen_137_part_10
MSVRRKGSISAGLAHIKAAIEADQAVKAGDGSRTSEALEGYRQAIELLDPSNDAITGLSQVDQDKLSQKRSQAQKRIVKLEKLAAPAPVAVPVPSAASSKKGRRGSISAGLAHIKAAIEADQAVKAGDGSRTFEALE